MRFLLRETALDGGGSFGSNVLSFKESCSDAEGRGEGRGGEGRGGGGRGSMR